VEIEAGHTLAAPVDNGEQRGPQATGLSDTQREALASALESLEQCRVLLDKART